MADYVDRYLDEVRQVVDRLDPAAIRAMLDLLARVRARGGRLFFLGVGGGAANSSHAVNDFRKIAGLESYAVTDNVGELTARINDDGWESSFSEWLKGCRLNDQDAVMVFSVGGGSEHTSVNIVRALDYARETGAAITGVVGRDGGHTARLSEACVVVPIIADDTITPLTEAFQAVVWHLLATGLAKMED